jgi:hypothetical protein
MSTNREKIGLAGLLFLHFLQETPFHKETGNTITKFVKTFQDTKPSSPQQIMTLYQSVNDPIAKSMAHELIRVMIAGDTRRLSQFVFLANTITTLYDFLTKTIVPTKSGSKDASGTMIPMPGDIISFIKILFLSLFDDELYREVEIFIKSVRPNYSIKNTIDVVKKTITDQRLKPQILHMLIPNETSIRSEVTLDLDKKIALIQQILSIIPPL